MPDESNNPNPALNPPPPPPPQAEVADRPVAKGDEVHVTLADGGNAEAEVVRVHKNGTVDVRFMHRGEEVLITGSTCGTKPDCWRFPS